MKFIYLIFIFLLTSCSDSSFEDSSVEETYDEREEILVDFSSKDITKACNEGCLYNYRIYTVAKSLKKDAVSLTQSQLDSIKNSCNYYCTKKVFSKLKQSLLSIKTKNINEVKRKKIDPPKVKKKDTNNSELIPFEEL